MRLPLALIALAATAPLLAQSAPQLPGQMDSARVVAGSYSTDPAHSLISWEVNHFGFSDYIGLFGDVTGTLTIDPANISAASVDVTIPVAKVTTASAGLTEHLLRAGKDGAKADFFGPEPSDAHFVSTKVNATGTAATIDGNLTLNGITKPVTLNAEFVGAGNNPFNKKLTVGFSATTMIKRSDFGIDTAIPFVSDEVALKINVAFEKN
ncbi:MAG: YceI family protein [Parasphingorhabdus sp.]|uniref:YceI family protein n=1 Tax=Parasphingorhabdus sp. TaxID=2709688 RepID=UPI00300269D2